MSGQDKFVLTFANYDQTLVEICTVALYFGLDICQGFVQVNPKSAWKMSDVRLLFHALKATYIMNDIFGYYSCVL